MTDSSAIEGAFNDNAIPNPGAPPQSVSDNLAAAYLASRRSALAALGFDPRHMAIGALASPPNFTVGGQYDPSQDRVVSTGVYPSTSVHESMHRGIQMLRDAGMVTPDMEKLSEEAVVRGQMARNYGDVEVGRGTLGDQQISDGKYYNRQFPDQMNAFETAAAKLFAQLHPGGPR
jgi:hypothetical protein